MVIIHSGAINMIGCCCCDGGDAENKIELSVVAAWPAPWPCRKTRLESASQEEAKSETSGCVLRCKLSSSIKSSSFIMTTNGPVVESEAGRRRPAQTRVQFEQEPTRLIFFGRQRLDCERQSSFFVGRDARPGVATEDRSSSASWLHRLPPPTKSGYRPRSALWLVALVSLAALATTGLAQAVNEQSNKMMLTDKAAFKSGVPAADNQRQQETSTMSSHKELPPPAAAATTETNNQTATTNAKWQMTNEKRPPLKRSPASSIFDSLLGSSATSTESTTNENQSQTDSSLDGNELAKQQHNYNQQQQHSHQQTGEPNPYFKIGQVPDKVTLPGDILLGGLFPIHMKGTKVECGQINRDRGIQRLEAMLYALDRINEDSLLLPDIKLGAILLDSCSSSTYALNQSLEFIRASINTVESSAFECKDKSTPRPKYGSKMIAGVIGGSYSEVSLQVANLLRLFRIPQVSYASTGTALSDKTLYDLFARTVPSDMFQARAIADIVNRMGWSYVSLVSSEGLYGDSGSKEFIKQASNRRICIAVHEKISPTIGDGAYDLIVQSLFKRNATGVVLFTRAEDTRELLMAVKRAKLLHNFAWVAADGWGTHQKLVEGVEEVAWGAITVELQAKAIPGFDQYMKKLTPWGNGRNPWFSEYWQEWFDCQLQANLLQQQRLASGAAYAAARRRSAPGIGTVDASEQVSYASTGTALSDKTLYDLFARTVPSDMFQARAIADIVNRMGWSYVSLVSSEGLYGDSGSKEFIKQASNRRICIAVHEKISPTIGDGAYDLIVQSLFKRNATGVVLFTRAEDTRELLMAVKRAKLLHNFAWVAADGWGTHQKLVEGVEEVAWGAITVELQAKAIPGFDQYMKKLTPWGNGRNPWFSEYWQEWFDCQLQANLLQQQRLASGAAYAAARRRSAPGIGTVDASEQASKIRAAWGLQSDTDGGKSEINNSNHNNNSGDEDYGETAARTRRSSGTKTRAANAAGDAAGSTMHLTGNAGCLRGDNATRCSMSKPSSGEYKDNESPVVSDPRGTATGQVKRSRRAASFELSLMDEESSHVKQFCSPNLRISESNGYRQEQKVQFVVDAVYAMAHALHKAWSHLCDAKPGVVCEALKELNGGEFYTKYLLNVSFKDLAGSEVKFDEHGDGLGRYNIYNFRQVRPQSAPPPNKDSVVPPMTSTPSDSIAELEFLGGGSPDAAPIDKFGGVPGSSYQQESNAGNSPEPVLVEHIYTSNVEFEYSTVGRWTEDDYLLSLNEIQFFQGGHTVPESYCSRPCEVGQAKIMRAGDHCCWICKTCQPYEFLPDEFSCQDCGIGRWPVANKTSCFDLPQKYLRWDSVFSLISLSVACLGIALTLFVTIIFVKYIDTPVVKASGRELSFILLAGVAFCHLATFVLLSKPTTFVCGGQRFLVNFGFALMYSSLLVKTNRISRIFNCARKSAKRPSFISPKSQMLITGILVGIQIFLTIIWYFFEPPGVRADSPEGKRDEVILKCRVKGRSFILSLVYNMILITTCTVYAVKTRKIPENFNESKFIGFTMYTTIVIWLAFVTMFFGTNNSYEIQMNTMCVCISLSAYVTLFCLFSPKISIILLHPDKNVRKLTMNSATYKRAFKPVSSVASIDGRHNPPPGGSSQPEAASGGLMSTTSNVLNLDTQGNRLQESSIVSNVVNSNSGGSNCSQKTATTLSQQLALVGICANCGAHQLTSAPTTTSASTNAGGSGGVVRHGGGKKAVSSASSARQTAGDQSQRWQTSTNGAYQQQSTESGHSFMHGSIRTTGTDVSTISTAAKILHQKTTIAGGPQQQKGPIGGDIGTTLRRQIKRSPSDELILTYRSGQQHNHSSSMHSTQQQQQHQPQSFCPTGPSDAGHSSDAYSIHRRKSSQANGRHDIGSLNRLNEITSYTSSGDRQCIEESISSLVNDSFMNTSLENTPCNVGHGPSQLSSAERAAIHCKGSDSMLCNQSVHSVDYCSDCCPSLCQCSCQVCLSQGTYENGGASLSSHRHNSTGLLRNFDDDYGFDGAGQENYDAMCIVQLVHRNDGQLKDGAALINDDSTIAQGGHLDTNETSCSTLIRCRKLSIESNRRPAASSHQLARNDSNSNSTGNQDRSSKMVSSKSGVEITTVSGTAGRTSATLSSSNHRNSDSQYDFRALALVESPSRVEEGQSNSKSARRSQTMEMRTMFADDGDESQGHHQHQHRGKSHQDYRNSGQTHSSNHSSGDSLDGNSQLAEHQPSLAPSKTLRKKLSSGSGPKQPSAAAGFSQSVTYALQAAATSALGAAASQIAAVKSGVQTADNNNDQQPEASSSSLGGVGAGGIQSKYGAPTRDKFNESSKTTTPIGAPLVSASHRGESYFEQQQPQLEEVDNLVVVRHQQQQVQPSANQTLGTIQASLERVKCIEARRKSMEASVANKNRRKSGCFNYHDDYEYSYGLVQSSDSDDESGGIEDYYYDDDDDDNDDDDGARECYYDEDTYLRLGYGLAPARKGGTSEGGVSGTAAAAGQAAKVSTMMTASTTTTTCDHGRHTNEPLVATSGGGGKRVDDDKSGSLGNDDDNFGHDGRVSFERASLNRARRSQQQQSPSRVITSNEEGSSRGGSGGKAIAIDKRSSPNRLFKHHSRRSSTKRRHNKDKRQPEPDELRINSVTLITATLSAGGAIVESGGGHEAPTARHQPGGDGSATTYQEADNRGQTASIVAFDSRHPASSGGGKSRDSAFKTTTRGESRQAPAEQQRQTQDLSGVLTSKTATSSQQQEHTRGEGSGATATYLGSF